MTALREATNTGSSAPGAPPRAIRPPWDRRRIELTAAAAILSAVACWAVWRTQIWDLSAVFGEGRIKIANFLFGTERRDGALPPRIEELGPIVDKVVETFFMAVAGTFIAAVISVPLAFCAARNTAPHPALRIVARGIIAFTRTVPDIIFAFVFVRVYRIGPLPGILALGVHAVGMVGKLMADAIEQSDPGPRQATAAQGGSWLQQMTTGVLPQVMPSFLATILFRLDINFRSSTVLGLVGAGGIGQLFVQYTGNLRWDLAMGVVLATMVTVLIVDTLSNRARRALLSAEGLESTSRRRRTPPAGAHRTARTAADVAVVADVASSPTPLSLTAQAGEAGTVPTGRLLPPFDSYRRRMTTFGAATAALIVASYFTTGVSLRDFFYGLRPTLSAPARGELPSVWYVGKRLIPFDFSTFTLRTDWWNPLVRSALFDTIAVGFAAAAIGVPLAVGIAYLAARNVAPNRFVYQVARWVLVVTRAFPDLIIAVILVVALGLGLIPGVVALIAGVVGFGGKLFADAIEDVEPGPRHGVRATGASRLQEAATGVTPQFVPALVGQGLYILDITIRSSTVLGIVGAGGIGAVLSNYLQSQRFEETGGILFAIFVVVFTIERLSDWLRARLL